MSKFLSGTRSLFFKFIWKNRQARIAKRKKPEKTAREKWERDSTVRY